MATRKARKSTKKKAKKPASWGGRRKGAGRPVGSGKGPSPDARYNRVAVMFNDEQIKRYKKNAKKAGLPVASYIHWLVTGIPSTQGNQPVKSKKIKAATRR